MAKRTVRNGRGSADSTASCTTRKVEPNSSAAATSASEAAQPPRRTAERYGTPGPAQVCAWYGPPPVLDRRLHVLLDDERFDRLARLASDRGVSVGALVRRAIDVAYPAGGERRSAARRPSSRPGRARARRWTSCRPKLDELRRRRTGGVIVLDTTVLVYATGAEHPLRAPCRRWCRRWARPAGRHHHRRGHRRAGGGAGPPPPG